MTSHRSSGFFPAAANELPNIRLTPAQALELRTYATQMMDEIVQEGPGWWRTSVVAAQDDGWKLESAAPDNFLLIKSAAKKPSRRESSQYDWNPNSSRSSTTSAKGERYSHMATQTNSGHRFLAHARLTCSQEDIIDNLYSDNTEDVRLRYTSTAGSSCLDSCSLAVIEGATEEDPFWYIGIKWVALKSPARKLVSSREFVFMEHTRSFINPSGQHVLFRIVQSINVRGYGGKESYFGLTRAHVEAAWVFFPDDTKGVVEKPVLNMCMKGRVCLQGSLPQWIAQMYVKRFWNAERTFFVRDKDAPFAMPDLHQTQQRQISSAESTTGSEPLEMATEWVPNDVRTACYVCHRKFQMMRRPKHHCRSCGEVICSECTNYTNLVVRPTHGDDRTQNNANEPQMIVGKVCHRCIEGKGTRRSMSGTQDSIVEPSRGSMSGNSEIVYDVPHSRGPSSQSSSNRSQGSGGEYVAGVHPIARMSSVDGSYCNGSDGGSLESDDDIQFYPGMPVNYATLAQPDLASSVSRFDADHLFIESAPPLRMSGKYVADSDSVALVARSNSTTSSASSSVVLAGGERILSIAEVKHSIAEQAKLLDDLQRALDAHTVNKSRSR
uniref:FYVE-type domain-containing protein n=1 Tax=Globisporangium ultimum (strain ATCC 200006 / CBS 805.95 / DAOM BR144) TaxID=431595 RepID=K3WAI9_GLOUD